VGIVCGESFVNTVGQADCTTPVGSATWLVVASGCEAGGRTYGAALYCGVLVCGVQFWMFISAAWLLWDMILADVSVLSFEWKVSLYELHFRQFDFYH